MLKSRCSGREVDQLLRIVNDYTSRPELGDIDEATNVSEPVKSRLIIQYLLPVELPRLSTATGIATRHIITAARRDRHNFKYSWR